MKIKSGPHNKVAQTGKIRPILRWNLRVAIVLAALVLAVTWQGDRLPTSGVAHAATWEGNWDASTGHWVGDIKWKFDVGGFHWTAAEKTVVRAAIAEWEALGDSSVNFEEVTEGADLSLTWDDFGADEGNTAGMMTGGENANAPTGVSFNQTATAGWYIDPDPTTDEAIPGGEWDLLSVAKHELGHAIGLKHTFGTISVMDSWTNGDRQHETEADAKAAAKLYPNPQLVNCATCPDPTFPVAGEGTAPVTAYFDLDFTPVAWDRDRECDFTGSKTVRHGNPRMGTDGYVVDTEIVSMELTGVCDLFGPLPVTIRVNPGIPSLGQVMDHNPDPRRDFPAESFFDVFMEIDIDGFGQTFKHVTDQPLRLHGEINGFPPLGAAFAPNGTAGMVFSAASNGQALESTCDPEDPVAIPIIDATGLVGVVGYICNATLMMEPPNSISVLKEAEGGQPLSGWKISLFAGAGCADSPIVSDSTDASGIVEFNNLGPLVYSVRETLKPGWEAISPICQDVDLTGAPGQVPVVFTNALALIQGNVDCDLDVDSVDANKVQRDVVGLSVGQQPNCPEIGSEVASLFGDVDCDGDVDAIDALKILRFVVGLPVTQTEPCPDIGTAL